VGGNHRQAVNSGFGMSFFDFLNSYRVKESNLLLGVNAAQAKAILDISFYVGFNSNSAFYAAFKKTTGQTPAQYRRDHLKKSSVHSSPVPAGFPPELLPTCLRGL